MKYSLSFVNLSKISIILSVLILHVYNVLPTVDKQAPITEGECVVFH
jgi:hypothetical protein